MDLRGHGLSGGKRVTFGILETNDLCRLRLALEASGQVRGPYVAMGHSLGAVLALRWQTVDRRSGQASPWGRLRGSFRRRGDFGTSMPVGCPRVGCAGRQAGCRGFWVEAESLETDAALRGHAPRAFLVASAQDLITPPEDASALREWGRGRGSGFLIVGGGTHETLPYLFEQHGPPIVEWLARVAREAAAGTE